MQHSMRCLSIFIRIVVIAFLGLLAIMAYFNLGKIQLAFAEPTAAEKQAEAESVLANLNAMQETLDRLSAEYGEALAAQETAESNRDAAAAKLAEINTQLQGLQDRLNERAREMYRTGGVSFVEALLGASSFQEFATNLVMFNKVNASNVQMMQERKNLAENAEKEEALYNEQARVAAQKSQEAAEAEEQAAATIAEMQATYDSLSAEAARLLEEERAAQAAAEAAARAAEEAARAAEEAARAAAESSVADDADTDSGENRSESKSYDGDSIAYEGGSDTVSRAQACLGAPYVWGGVGPHGYDCSGLVSYCLTGNHSRLGTTYTFMGWPKVSNPQPGDICVNWTHTGIYIGDGQMIHASTYGVGVIVGPVQSGMIYVRYSG